LILLLFIPGLFNQEMRIHVTVKAVGHFLVHDCRMRFSMAFLALRHIWMLAAMAERAGECLVLRLCFLHQFADFTVTWDTECPWSCLCRIDFQWMVGRMTSQTIRGHLARGMGFMTIRAIRDLAVYLMAESTGLLGMGAYEVGKILSRTIMTGKARLLDITRQMEGKGFMWIGMAGKTIFQFKMGLPFMAHGALGYNIFSPWWMLLMTIKTCDRSLVLPTVAGYGCRRILVALHTVCHIQGSQLCFRLMSKCHYHHTDDKNRTEKST
jgi:hypothetical protein